MLIFLLWEKEVSWCLSSSQSTGSTKGKGKIEKLITAHSDKEMKSSEVRTLFFCISLGTKALCNFCPNCCLELSGRSKAQLGEPPSPWKLLWKLPGSADLWAGHLCPGRFVPLG